MQENGRVWQPDRATDYLNNIGLVSNTAEKMVRILNLCAGEKEVSRMRGPTLALYAGTAEAEREFVAQLNLRDSKIVALDYNPALKNSDSQTAYNIGDLVEGISKLKTKSFGIMTIFHADGSMSESDWTVIQKEAARVLRPGGHIIIYPNPFIRAIPNGFESAIDDPTWSVVFLRKSA